MEKILPIGSIVKLKKSDKKIMIFGTLQTNGYVKGVVYDYVGVPYPEGNVDIRLHIGFQSEDIEEVIFTGYMDESFDAMKQIMELKRSE